MLDLLIIKDTEDRVIVECRVRTYAAASAVMDAILIRTILCWVLQIRILMYLYLDS